MLGSEEIKLIITAVLSPAIVGGLKYLYELSSKSRVDKTKVEIAKIESDQALFNQENESLKKIIEELGKGIEEEKNLRKNVEEALSKAQSENSRSKNRIYQLESMFDLLIISIEETLPADSPAVKVAQSMRTKIRQQ